VAAVVTADSQASVRLVAVAEMAAVVTADSQASVRLVAVAEMAATALARESAGTAAMPAQAVRGRRGRWEEPERSAVPGVLAAQPLVVACST
jgi:hypothetical protein